jgi:hypothetical protein
MSNLSLTFSVKPESGSTPGKNICLLCSEDCSDEDSDDGYMEDFFSREACSAPVLEIQILSRIRLFLGLLDPNPLVSQMYVSGSFPFLIKVLSGLK